MKSSAHKRLAAPQAFSLIEVVLALAVATVGVVAIIGLFPQGLTSARNAIDDSLVSMIVQDTVAARRVDIQTGSNTVGIATAANTRWFAADGKETNSALAAMFKCEVFASKPYTGMNLELTQVRVLWPWYNTSTTTKTPPPANTNIFMTEIVKY